MASIVTRARLWFRALLTRRGVEADLAREIGFHLEMEREKLVREGVPPDEADRRARLAFGAVERFTEEVRDERGTRWLDDLGQDVRFAFRYFRRAPWITVTMIAMLALGIGANSFLFAIIDRGTSQPPGGIPSSRSLVRIRGLGLFPGRVSSHQLSYPDLSDYRAERAVFSRVAGWTTSDVVIYPPEGTDPVRGGAQLVTSGFFETLGVRPVLGTALPPDPDDVSTTNVGVVVSHRFWRSRLGGAPDIIGKSMKVGGALVTILGVAPPGFKGAGIPHSIPSTAIWVPLSARTVVTGQSGDALVRRDLGIFYAVARLRDGVSMSQADAMARAVASRPRGMPLREGFSLSADVVPLRANNLEMGIGRSRGDAFMLIALGVLAMLILAIVCTNVSVLVLGRAVTRKREIGVRLSLGASRGRLVRQLVTESVVLAVAASGLGLVGLALLTGLVKHWLPDIHLPVGWWTVVGTIAFAIGTGVIFGLSPALHATKASVGDALKESGSSGTRQTRFQRRLIVAHIALGQPLLVGLGILVGGAVQVERERLQSDVSERTILIELSTGFGARDREEVPVLVGVLKERIVALPAVEEVADAVFWHSRDEFESEPPSTGGSFSATIHPVGEGYFNTLNLRVARGREFDRTDLKGAPLSIIIDSDLARDLWGNDNPIGKRLRCRCDRGPYTVVGVVDAAHAGVAVSDGRARLYVATAQYRDMTDPALVIRVNRSADAMIPDLLAHVRQTAPGTPLGRVSTLAQRLADKRAERMWTAAAATGGGLLALIMAAVGLYAVVAFAVNDRAREIGVRVALGARPVQVIAYFFRGGLTLTLIGLAIGLPTSVLAIRAFPSGIVAPTLNPWAVAAAMALLVTGVAALATWLPARRAALVDPIATLRAE